MSSTSSILQGVNNYFSGKFLNTQQPDDKQVVGGVIPRHSRVSRIHQVPRKLHLVKHKNVLPMVKQYKITPFKIDNEMDELSNLFSTIKVDRRRGKRPSTVSKKSKKSTKSSKSTKSASVAAYKKPRSPNVDDLLDLFKRTSLSFIEESPRSSRPSRNRKAPERLTYHKNVSKSRSKKINNLLE